MKLRYWAIGCMAILYYVVSFQAEPYEIKEGVVECGFPAYDPSSFALEIAAHG